MRTEWGFLLESRRPMRICARRRMPSSGGRYVFHDSCRVVAAAIGRNFSTARLVSPVGGAYTRQRAA
jgi:hypothetical protein